MCREMQFIVHFCSASINCPVLGSLWTPGCPEDEVTFRLFFSYSWPLSPCPLAPSTPSISISPPLSPARFIIDGCPAQAFLSMSLSSFAGCIQKCMCVGVCGCAGQFLHICRLHFSFLISQSGWGKGCFSPPGEGVSHLDLVLLPSFWSS